MALAGLMFRPRVGDATAKDVADGVILRGEVEWLVEGGESEIASLLAAVAGLGVKVSTQSAIVKFGNVVGSFNVTQLGCVHVECGKWSEQVFDTLLEELTQRALALPFSATQAAGLPHDRSIADRDDVLLHAFIYARQILIGSNRGLANALDVVVRDPHRRFTPERVSVQLAAARRIDARTIAGIASGTGGVVRASGSAAQSKLSQALAGYLPMSVDVPKLENTFDTAENRFVLEFLRQLRGIIDRVERRARSKNKSAAFWTRVLSDCEAMRRVLAPYERHDMWNGVGRMGQLPIGSSVLQRRRGYKDILRHHLALRAAARIPFDRHSVERLLGLKDVATLYELWCYFAVVDAVELVVGRRPDYVDAMAVKDEVDLPYGFRVTWSGGPSVYYNLSFTQKKAQPYRSASLWLRPDIVLEFTRDGQTELHAFDAKLRIDGVPPAGDTDDDGSEEAQTLSFKNDDIAKMHAYRDALPHMRSARVLYPGNERCDFPALEPEARGFDGVGAIPLVPGQPPTDLVDVLSTIIPKTDQSMSHDRSNGPKEPSMADLTAVADMLRDIEQLEGTPVHWSGGDRQPDGSVVMPYPVTGAAVGRLVTAIYDRNIIVSFDWTTWQEAERFVDPVAVNGATLDEVRRLLTLHVRQDRFVTGHLAEAVANGHVGALLRRLQALVEQAEPGLRR